MDRTCHVCSREVGDAHTCKRCKKFIHVICGTPEGDEGYGQKVTCNTCQEDATAGIVLPLIVEHDLTLDDNSEGGKGHESNEKNKKKRQLQWDWKQGCASKTKDSVLGKKQKLPSKTKSGKIEKYFCLQCLEVSLRGNREERFATLCRIDNSSVARHKARWHNTPESRMCTVIPSTAPEIITLQHQYGKTKAVKASSTITTTSRLSQPRQTLEESSTSVQIPGGSPVEQPPMEVSADKEPERSCNLGGGGDTPAILETPTHQATLLSFKSPAEVVCHGKDFTLVNVMAAIASLSLKVDQFGKQHATLEQLVFEDDNVRKAVLAMREATNIRDLSDVSDLLDFFYDEDSETAVLSCSPCFQVNVAAKPTLSGLSPFQAQQMINPLTNGTLGTGIILNKDTTRLLIEGHNQTWYRQKKSCIDHLCLIGDGSKVHKSAMEAYQRETKTVARKTSVTGNIFRAAIADLKLGAAARHFETWISFLACCSVHVGNIGHSRNHFNDILYCLEKTVNSKINAWLNQPLPSTLLPPHIWATLDKATPSRTTNQAVLVVARNETGIPCPIPVAAPGIYTQFEEASYDLLAELLIKAIEENFSKEVLSRLCGIAADGPYQARGFREKLLEALDIVETGNDQLALPVTWDPAHILNLAVVGVKDSKSSTGTVFQTFVKRCNVFNTILANGKGFAFLQLVDEFARRPVAYACQRFASSSYEQWLKIEKSYSSFWKAFEMLNPNRKEEEELQYKIAGWDFVADLLAFLDVLEPIVDLMLRVQSLDTPIWKLKVWWPKVIEKLEKAASGNATAFPRLEQAGDVIKAGGQYKGVTLLEGWLVSKDEGREAGMSRFTWKMREESDVTEDHKCLALDLMTSLDTRVKSVASDHSLSVLQVFDAAALVELHCGSSCDGTVKLAIADGEYESYGVEECEAILVVASKMAHIRKSGMDFDPRLAFRYMSRIKAAVMAGVWNSLCPEWFILQDKHNGNTPLQTQDSNLVQFEPVASETLDVFFKMQFANGKEFNVRLHEENVYKSFYCNEEIYGIAKPPSCAIIDIVLAKGGPEAIAESYYSAMRAQQQSGGQANETLARRTKLNWCLPSLKQCDAIIQESVCVYLQGYDVYDVIRPHRKRAFFSGHASNYSVSKVVDRVDSDLGRCPFLADIN